MGNKINCPSCGNNRKKNLKTLSVHVIADRLNTNVGTVILLELSIII